MSSRPANTDEIQADLDLLRAKRATELAERQAREKERKEAEHRVQLPYSNEL